MFEINEDYSIYCTRGDIGAFAVSAEVDKEEYVFQAGDVVRLKVFEKKNCDNVVLQKSFPVTEDKAGTTSVVIVLDNVDTKFGDTINKPTDYWYEVELVFANGRVVTIIGYDDDGAKIFKLFPEGKESPVDLPTPEDMPLIDKKLDATSPRPVENQAITRETLYLRGRIKELQDEHTALINTLTMQLSSVIADAAVESARVTNLASLDEGSTTGDAELIDARVGADGVIYASAGEAARVQMGKVNNTLREFTNVLPSVNLFDVSQKTDGKTLWDTDGELHTQSVISTSDFMPVEVNSTYRFYFKSHKDSTFTQSIPTVICFYDEDKAFISGAENPTGDITIPSGCKYVRFSIQTIYIEGYVFTKHTLKQYISYVPEKTYTGNNVDISLWGDLADYHDIIMNIIYNGKTVFIPKGIWHTSPLNITIPFNMVGEVANYFNRGYSAVKVSALAPVGNQSHLIKVSMDGNSTWTFENVVLTCATDTQVTDVYNVDVCMIVENSSYGHLDAIFNWCTGRGLTITNSWELTFNRLYFRGFASLENVLSFYNNNDAINQLYINDLQFESCYGTLMYSDKASNWGHTVINSILIECTPFAIGSFDRTTLDAAGIDIPLFDLKTAFNISIGAILINNMNLFSYSDGNNTYTRKTLIKSAGNDRWHYLCLDIDKIIFDSGYNEMVLADVTRDAEYSPYPFVSVGRCISMGDRTIVVGGCV